ncbi:hypothetical protein [Acetobacter senegalensis]|uniref:hypothetical protein n=1 Tax=Acetobacter senegalensis TaxID=446692 RepID=UPI00128B6147|nr:hypothetical protein [Acetobacter senegalensis]MPQ72651.1 hypothetical protein [Acetobacter senegalensis]
MSNRDEFSKKTKEAVALRANHHCSFRNCPQPTSGPSDESPQGVNMIGKAAHIHAAASGPGARRYLASMTHNERTHITNAIWLCATHADLIDRDEVTYTADVLRAMKSEHEAKCAERQRNALSAGEPSPDLIAIGPDIVFVGKFLGVEGEVWSFHLQSFIGGDVHTLITFADCYDKTATSDRFVLVNELGDGRALRAKPSVTRETTGGYTVRCPVFPSAERISAADIPKSWALSDSHDLMTNNGNWTMVSGVDALPQQLKTCLSHQKGESPLHRDFGTRFAEYYNLLSGSLWLDRYLNLEVIRQASIPYIDPTNNQQYTPLLCVERVFAIKILSDTPTKNWLPIRVDLSVKGLGRWQHDLSVCIPQEPIRRWSFDELLSGPFVRG